MDRRSWIVTSLAAAAGAPATAAPPPLRLEGADWTPNRGPDDQVLDSDFAALPRLTWLNVKGERNRLLDVLEQPPYPQYSGAPGGPRLLNCWTGAAWNPRELKMITSGGGHGDSSAADVGIYEADARRMRVRRVVDRAPYGDVLRADPAPGGGPDWLRLRARNPPAPTAGVFPRSEPAYPSGNAPLRSGRPSAWHTYHGLVWVPPEVGERIGLAATRQGWLFYPSHCRALISLDDATGRTFSQPHYQAAAELDTTYCAHWLDTDASGKVQLLGYRGTFNWTRFALDETEFTDWQTCVDPDRGDTRWCPNPEVPSRGRRLPGLDARTPFPHAASAVCQLTERREAVAFHGDQRAVRVRYGEALDALAGSRTSAARMPGWMDAYLDPIELVSDNDRDHLDFAAAHYAGHDGRRLQQCGAAYDAAADAIWVQPNGLDPELGLYRVDQLRGRRWRVRKHDLRPPTPSPTGTYGRFRVFRIGGVPFALRWAGAAAPLQVIRLDDRA